MPALKQETIDRRNKLYKDNEKMLRVLYTFFGGNVIQKQAREFIIKAKISNSNNTQYTIRSFNKVIAELEKENMIGRKQYYDTNNKCIVYKKYLISLITGEDNINNIKRTSMGNKYFEVYDVNLFKSFFIIQQLEKGKKTKDYLDKNTMFIDNSQILSIYDDFIRIAKKKKPNSDYNVQYSNKEIYKNKISQIHRARNKQKEENQNDNNDNINISSEKGNYNFKVCDLYSLKNRKIFLTNYIPNSEVILFEYAIFCSSTNYDTKKLCNNLGDTIVSTLEFFNGIYDADKILFNFSIYTYSENAKDIMKSGFNDLRNINYKNGNSNKRYNFTYHSRLLKNLGLSSFKDNFTFTFYNTNINNDFREEAVRFDLKTYNKKTGKKENYQTLEERLNKRDEEIKSINEKSDKQIEEKNLQIQKIVADRDLKIEKLNKEKEQIILENQKTKQGTEQTFLDLHKKYNSIISKKDDENKTLANENKKLKEKIEQLERELKK